MPMNLLAADHCTNPKEYTVDKRCYVTDEQKKTKPYEAVVGLVGAYGIDCVGTIVKHGDEWFLYTAKHCVRDKNKDNFDVILMNGTKSSAKVLFTGSYKQHMSFTGEYSENSDDDWAVARFYDVYMPFVELSEKKTDDNAMSVGYGNLKIMSDAEISEFKNKYIKFLKKGGSPYVIKKDGKYVPEGKVKVTPKNAERYGFVDKDGVTQVSGYIQHFLTRYYEDLTSDENLKVSFCKYDSTQGATGCQGWQGDSGGGLFDSQGNLMAIRAYGQPVIGGMGHAGAKNTDGYISVFKIVTE